MALLIDNPEVERLALELAQETGESVEDAVALAIREWLSRQVYIRKQGSLGAGEVVRDPVVEAIRERMLRQPRPDRDRTIAAIRQIQEHLSTLPVLDPRSPDELLGYDEYGLPH
jgi:antitoxin VapB